MVNIRLGRFVYMLLAGTFLVGAFLLLRLQRVEAKDLVPTVNPEQAGEIYHERMEATERLLETDRLEVTNQ